ncbi:MHS family MFS transporter [Micrococcus terreus]|uniref:MFS transporter n=1 Tax=Micrococcus terreus TaxID=574650 RepID=UPI0021A38C5C|nr:MFS transporter [Micrococcus terreus]MCT2088225.1 MHS family MFS transporter [Micrococcus terreus]
MSTVQPQRTAHNQRRVSFATLIGTTIEWYDFFIYATMAGLVFAQLFFEPAGESIGLLLAFASVGISFLFRPLGAFLAGHYGDKIGRRAILVLTLLLMGGATTLIGVLPTYETAGVIAPVMLLLLRVVQGISAGGEWGGAVLMAVEHADDDRRGRAGAFPQLGVPLGMLLATGVTAVMTGWIAPGDAFLEWGWRVPFLLSIVLIVVGYFVRRAVDESPVFQEIAAASKQSKVPILELFRKHGLLVIIAALIFAGNNAAGYMATGGFIPAYATSEAVGLERTEVLTAVTYGAAMWMVSTFSAGVLSDRIGRKNTYLIGFAAQLVTCFPLFWLINTGELPMLYLAMTLFTIGLGLSYGPQAALYSEMFPASVRFSGISISYALGAILGGAFAPTIATALVQATGGTTAVSWYLVGMTVISIVAVLLVRDRTGIDLSIRNQAAQEVGATVYDHRQPQVERQDSTELASVR